jgi:integrase
MPKLSKKRKIRKIVAEEFERLLAVAPTGDWRAFICTAWYTGMRRSEMLRKGPSPRCDRRYSMGRRRGYQDQLSFNNLDHGHLRTFLRLRVRDGVLLRLIDRWLKAGVMEDGSVSYPEARTPQRGVVSPL